MSDKTSELVTPDEVARLLRDAGAPEPANSVEANQQLASVLNLMMQFPISEQPVKLSPEATRLNSAVSSLRRALPGYIEFWEGVEAVPNLPEGVRQKVENLRELRKVLGVAFPEDLKVHRKATSCWQQVGPDLFEFHARTPWHERALYLYAWYQTHMERACGISRDSAVSKFVKAALERSKGGCHSLDAIEKAVARALQVAS